MLSTLAWQRMHALNIEMWSATNRLPAHRDFDFRDELRDAADSAERNIAEGFGRFSPGDFARFLDISRASALETKTLLNKGHSIGYWSEMEWRRLDQLADRGLQVVAKFQRYLRSPQAKHNAARRYKGGGGRKKMQNANVPNDPNA